MKMIKAIVRPEKAMEVLAALADAGFYSASKMSILGRGRQRGLKVDNQYYDEIPKEMIMMVVPDKDVDAVQSIIIKAARSGRNGNFGDGKIFILSVARSITISSGAEE